MISRSHRFHGHGSLRYVYQHGQTIRGPLISLKYAENKRRTSYRLAIVVSKKVHKSAVRRNRIRRRLFEAFRLETPHLTGPYDMVVTVFHDQVADMPSDELRRMVHAQMHQAGMLKK
jgi:ribonuclease P protein component